jgi:hypothetical protein
VRRHGLRGEDQGGGRTAYLEGRSLHLVQQQLWALETGQQIVAESGLGPLDWSVLSPTAVHWDGSSTSLHAGPIGGGLRGTGRVHVRGGSSPGSQWAAESERGPRDSGAEPHGQFTRTR